MAELKTIDAEGCRMTYSVEGTGRPIVMMHGWGCEGKTLATLSNVAVKDGYKVYSVDFPGFGKSEEPPYVWGVEEYTIAIERLVKEEALENVTLLGHSFGGRVAILYASRNNCEKVILVDAAGVKPKRSYRYYLKIYRTKLLKKAWRFFLSPQKADRRIEDYRKRHGSADYAAASPRMRAVLSKVVNEDLRKIMPKIKAPTLLMWGSNDTATPMNDAKIMNRLIPDSGLVEFPGCGHYSFLDNPVGFQKVLSHFLKN